MNLQPRFQLTVDFSSADISGGRGGFSVQGGVKERGTFSRDGKKKIKALDMNPEIARKGKIGARL